MNNCPNCGSNTNPGDAFCNVCGTNLSLPQNNSLNNPQVNNQIQNSVQIQGLQQMPSSNNTIGSQNDMEVLVDAYIGKNADKIKNGKFSFCSFFFGVIYVFYRKMWSVGLKWLVINIIIGGISSTAIWSAINMIQSGIIDISIVPIIFANVIYVDNPFSIYNGRWWNFPSLCVTYSN